MPTAPAPSWLRLRLAGLGATVSGLLCIATLFAFLGPQWWGFELLVPFRVQYCVAALVALGLARLAPGRGWWLAVAALAVNFAFVAPEILPQTSPAAGPVLRVMSFNVLTGNRDFNAVKQEISSHAPDVIFALEVDQGWSDALTALEGYHVVVTRPTPGHFGIMALSRVPISQHEVRPMGELLLPSITLVVPWQGRELELLATHTLPPVNARTTEIRDRHLEQVARWSRSSTRAFALFGDLNITPFSRAFDRLRSEGGLHRVGGVLQGTWPARPGWLVGMSIVIDHALLGDQLVARAFEVGEARGSDHRPIVVDLAFAP